MAADGLGAWVDVDNQLARIAPVLSSRGVWVRFMRDTGMPPRLGVVNPSTIGGNPVRAEVTAVRYLDGDGWMFLFHTARDAMPLPLGADVIQVGQRVALLLGVLGPEAGVSCG